MPKLNNPGTFLRGVSKWWWLAAVVVLAGGFLFFKRVGRTDPNAPTFTVRHGPLEIDVLEGGSLQALEFQEIKCEVRVGYQGTKILKIVEEGYLVTDEDVKNGKVLVELDSSELEKQIVQQEVQYQSALANLTDGQQNYEIQLNQNQSDIRAAEQKVRFARMDFDKLLGDGVTREIVEQLGLDQLLASAMTNDVQQLTRAEKDTVRFEPLLDPNTSPVAKTSGPPASIKRDGHAVVGDLPPVVAAIVRTASNNAAPPAPVEAPSFEMPKTLALDFSRYANIEMLGDGEAKQKLRKFEDDLQVARKELTQATNTLEGTRRLFEKGFVTRTDLQRDEIAFENSRLKVQTAETARDLYLKYDFAKSAEEMLSKYAEAVREFDKARRVAVSRLAQAEAKLKSAEGQYQVQMRQRIDLQNQLARCTLRAEKPGLVVYGSGREERVYYGNQEPIGEGATVRERQAIITIPNLTRMSVNVKIHESYIKKIQKGQKARITIDAVPDKVLTGEVSKVGVIPDSQNRWMNPDLKVYLTTVTVDGTHDWLKPGMSAKVEILVDKLDDVVYVPVQAVSPNNGKYFCYVMNGSGSERRDVEVGQFNDQFIEVRSGLKPGERVLLRPPRELEGETPAREGEQERGPEPPQTQPIAKREVEKRNQL